MSSLDARVAELYVHLSMRKMFVSSNSHSNRFGWSGKIGHDHDHVQRELQWMLTIADELYGWMI